MAIKFKEVTEIDPWDKFAEDADFTEGRGDIPQETVTKVAKRYHEWLEKQNPIVGACIVCERRFKPRSEPKKKPSDEIDAKV